MVTQLFRGQRAWSTEAALLAWGLGDWLSADPNLTDRKLTIRSRTSGARLSVEVTGHAIDAPGSDGDIFVQRATAADWLDDHRCINRGCRNSDRTVRKADTATSV